MATFNPETPDVGVSNFLGFSRGAEPDRSFETVLSGIAQMGEQTIKMVDEKNQADIYDQADAIFQQTNEEFGFTPPGVTEGVDRIKTLQTAMQQGKISEVNYYGRLAALTKQLRSQYPGYEQVVDNTIMAVTGTRPANAYRDAIFSEINSVLQGQADSVKFRRQYEKENEGIINAVFGEDYFRNPEGFDFEEVRAKVSSFKGTAELIDAEAKELQLLASRGENNDRKAKRLIDRDFSFTTESVLNRALSLNGPSWQATIDSFVSRGGAAGPELDQFISQISEVETTLRAELMKVGRERYLASGLISADDMNKAIESAMYPIVEAKKAVLGGDFKLAARYATVAKSMQDYQLGQLMRDPTIAVGAGLSEINSTLGETFMGANYSAIDTVAMEIVGRTIAGTPNSIKNTIEEGNSRASRQVLKASFTAIVDPNLTGEKFSNLIDQYFGPSAIDFMSPDVVASDDLKTIYLDFLRPEVTTAIKTKGTPEDLQKYTEWAFTKALAIPEFRTAAGEFNALRANLEREFKFEFDPQNFRVNAKRIAGPSFMTGVDGLNSYGGMAGLRDVNQVLQVLKPIWEANGMDPATSAVEFLNSLAIAIEGPQKVGLFSTLANADQITTGSISKDGNGKGLANLVEEDEGFDDVDFSFEQEDYDYDLLDDESLPEKPEQGVQSTGLVSSNKRGYDPDLKGLKPQMTKAVLDLQSAWGKGLPIVSGFRDKVRNSKAGGAKHSRHIQGDAVDIDVSGMPRSERVRLIKLARQMGFGGVGVYPNSLHLDLGSRRAWGPSFRNKSLPGWAREVL
ncbi:MAG: YcbK family protein [Candidatus Obscuribacterales bacterium]